MKPILYLLASALIAFLSTGCGNEAIPIKSELPERDITLMCPLVGKIYLTARSLDVQIETARGIEKYPHGLRITKQHYILPHDSEYWFGTRKEIEIDRVTLHLNFPKQEQTGLNKRHHMEKCDIVTSVRL